MEVTVRSVRLAIAVAIHLVALAVGCAPASAAEPEGGPAIVGLAPAPPFAMRDAGGEWQGIAVDLWRHVALDLGLRFEFREMAIPDLIAALQRGELTAVATATASADSESLMDFSHPYYSSHLAIAVRKETGASGWLDLLASFASAGVLKLASLLIGLTALAGILVWLCERRANPEQFSTSPLQGMGDGVWWAAVTTTTVGYGDKAPRTRAGRLVAVVWMFTAVILIALFTAQVTSSLTLTSLGGLIRGPADLARVRVGALEASPNIALLRQRLGVAATSYPSFDDGLRALDRGAIDAFVAAEPILRHEIARAFAGRVNVIVAPLTRTDYVFAFPNGSPIRKQANRAILSYLDTDSWTDILRSHLGAQP